MHNPGITVPFEGPDWIDFDLNVDGDVRHFRVSRDALQQLDDARGPNGPLLSLYQRHVQRIHEVAKRKAKSDTDTDRIELRTTYFK